MTLTDFLAQATTRGGFDHAVTEQQQDAQGKVTTVKGTVTYAKDGESITQAVIWNATTGIALNASRGFDLVVNVPITA